MQVVNFPVYDRIISIKALHPAVKSTTAYHFCIVYFPWLPYLSERNTDSTPPEES